MKKALCLFLCVIAVTATLCSCKSIKNPEAISDLTYVDDQGKTHMYSTDNKGEAATDAKGEKVTTTTASKASGSSELDIDMTVLVTDKDGEYVTDKNGKAVTEKMDAASVVKDMMEYSNLDSLNQDKNVTKNGTTKASGKTANSKSSNGTTTAAAPSAEDTKKELLDEGKKAADTTLKKTVIDPVIKSGTFTIDGSISAEGMNVATTFAFRNSKDYSISFNVGGIGMRVFSNNGKYYLALTTLGLYSEIPQDEFEDYKDMADAFDSKDAKYVKTTTVKDGGVTYTCEEYKSDDGTIKYYFNSKKEWKRMEIIDGDSAFIWKINSFKNTAKASLFEVSKFWKKSDDLLGAFGG